MPPKSPGSTVTPVSQSVILRATGAIAGAIRGATEAWFGPLQPLPQAAPESARGRQFDYPVGFNLPYQPRTEAGQTGVTHEQLRALADPTQGGYDLVRLAIETRKDQMACQQWSIKGRDGSDGGKRARLIEAALERPDGVHTFLAWQRMLLEDLLVLDAPTVYVSPVKSLAGKTPEVLDGALLKPLVMEDGRIPRPPDSAYVQVLKGLPAVHYTLEEIVRQPRNPRSHKTYGFSPVEQIIVTINIALRRQVSQLEYYTAGSIPDMLASVPKEWTTKQIGEFQAYWDTLMSGNTEERRRLRFVPGDMKPYESKAGLIKDEYDEWLARLVMYAFSLSPQALVQQMNRATAETAKESADLEGLEPLKIWWRDFVNEVLLKAFGAADLTLAYADEEIADPMTKAAVTSQLVTAGVMSIDEARKTYGLAVEEEDNEDTAAVEATGAEAVQDTALNGAQLSSLKDLVMSAANKELPIGSVRGMIAAAFPALGAEQVEAILGGLDGFEPARPESKPVPPQLAAFAGKESKPDDGEGDEEQTEEETEGDAEEGGAGEAEAEKVAKAAPRRSLRQACQAGPSCGCGSHRGYPVEG